MKSQQVAYLFHLIGGMLQLFKQFLLPVRESDGDMEINFYIRVASSSATHVRDTFPTQADERPGLCAGLNTDFEWSVDSRHLRDLSKRSLGERYILLNYQIVSLAFKLLIRPDFEDNIKIVESNP